MEVVLGNNKERDGGGCASVMKILHYIFGRPPVRGGGSVRYALDLMEQELAMGEEGSLLFPGTLPKDTDRQVKICRSMGNSVHMPAYCIYNPLPVSMCNGILDIAAFTKKCNAAAYAVFLQQIKPDIIHIHTLMGLHQEFMAEAQKMGIPIVFTTHDYFGICPTANMVFADRICTDRAWKQCGLCCQNAYSMKKLRLEQSGFYHFYRKHRWMVGLIHKGVLKNYFQSMRAPEIAYVKDTNKIGGEHVKDYSRSKKYYEDMFGKVSCFHFNSTLSRDIYCTRLRNIKGIVLQVSHAGIGDHRKRRKYGKKLRIGYFGGLVRHKGGFQLLDVCRELYEEGCQNLELHIYSDTWGREEAFAVNHGNFQKGQLVDVFEDIDILAVPSQCPETFGLVVLEAFSYGVPVLVSKNVGAKDILQDHSGCGIQYDGSAAGLKYTIRQLYEEHEQLLGKMNHAIRGMDDIFSYQAHVEKIIRMYQDCIRRKL